MNKLKIAFNRFVVFCAFMWMTATIPAADEPKAREFVNRVAKEIINTVSNKNLSEAKFRDNIHKIIASNFDIVWMSKFTSGQVYKTLSDEKKQEYAEVYLTYLVSSYLPILSKYTNEAYSISKVSASVDLKNFDVDVIILRYNGKPPLAIRYHIIEQENGELKARDMIIEGVSTILNQRSEFINTLQSKGIDGLIVELKSGNKNPKSY